MCLRLLVGALKFFWGTIAPPDGIKAIVKKFSLRACGVGVMIGRAKIASFRDNFSVCAGQFCELPGHETKINLLIFQEKIAPLSFLKKYF